MHIHHTRLVRTRLTHTHTHTLPPSTHTHTHTQDLVDPVVDEQLALFVVNSHIRSHPDLKDGVIEEERETVKDGLARDLGIRLIAYLFVSFSTLCMILRCITFYMSSKKNISYNINCAVYVFHENCR